MIVSRIKATFEVSDHAFKMRPINVLCVFFFFLAIVRRSHVGGEQGENWKVFARQA